MTPDSPPVADDGSVVVIVTCKASFSVGRMRPFTLRVRSANVLPKRLSLAQRFTPTLSHSTLTVRAISVGTASRRPRWTCDEYFHARVHGIRSVVTIAPSFSLGNDDPIMSNLTPPQAPATWTHTPEQVTTLINESIAKDRALWNKIGSLPSEECTFESVRLLYLSTRP